MGGEPMSVYEYDETMENVNRHPDAEDEVSDRDLELMRLGMEENE
tara:strand:+ start:202 stop:336 length:135 start_codon:yes stop_codon:yes gene_type:complete